MVDILPIMSWPIGGRVYQRGAISLLPSCLCTPEAAMTHFAKLQLERLRVVGMNAVAVAAILLLGSSICDSAVVNPLPVLRVQIGHTSAVGVGAARWASSAGMG
jgi:hypothetical protein